ncbi:MAG: GTPase [Gammaproteobacteria bacterium]
MPANLTPVYRKAEEAYRRAREPGEKLEHLKEMLRTIPKHKGTDHLQGDIKRWIKEITEELGAAKQGGKKKGPVHTIRPEGAAQLALIGAPNAGKSQLHTQLTGSKADIGPYPFTTKLPQPGMLPFEDVWFQLVDLPPVSSDYIESWIVNALQPADGVLLVVDLADPGCAEHIQAILRQLAERKIDLHGYWPGLRGPKPEPEPQFDVDGEEIIGDPFRISLPAILVGNKCDLGDDPAAELEVLTELLELDFPTVHLSALTGAGCEAMGPLLFEALQVVRVYTKQPGKPAETDRPFTLRRGQTVLDVAGQVHKDIASALRYAKIWGAEVFAGQQVGPEHVLGDKDIIELHMK